MLAVNKIDLVELAQDVFEPIVEDFKAFAKDLGVHQSDGDSDVGAFGDNVIEKSPNTPWYNGPTFLSHLETVDVETALAGKPFRMPVQWVNRPNLDFRGFSGTIVSGRLRRATEWWLPNRP